MHKNDVKNIDWLKKFKKVFIFATTADSLNV